MNEKNSWRKEGTGKDSLTLAVENFGREIKIWRNWQIARRRKAKMKIKRDWWMKDKNWRMT